MGEDTRVQSSVRYALLSVSDRSGIETFASGLCELGFTLLATSGTGQALKSAGIPYLGIDEYTGQPEILGGRVKTLHPKIHAGILAKRSNQSHLRDLYDAKIAPIDVVAVNLYPFEQQLSLNPNADLQTMIEFIDIGGPTMIRAAAKNFENVYAVIDPLDYTMVLAALAQDVKSSSIVSGGVDSNSNEGNLALRGQLASKIFAELGHYNLEIAKFLSHCPQLVNREVGVMRYSGSAWRESQTLRYGENPGQSAALFDDLHVRGDRPWRQISGKELSYNNLLDADACFRLTRDLALHAERYGEGEFACIIKHLTPCGVALGSDQVSALRRAKSSDSRSHFGGILGFGSPVTRDTADEIIKDFAEIVLAPSFHDEALKILQKRPNIRLIECNLNAPLPLEVRSTIFGYLQQTPDDQHCAVESGNVVVGRLADNPGLLGDLNLAWTVVSHVRSNAIVLVKDQMMIGAGAGQTSRIDSVEVALYKAKEHGHITTGASAASDAFFPFEDNITRLGEAGVCGIVAPSGAKKDDDVIRAAEVAGITLFFVSERHFRH